MELKLTADPFYEEIDGEERRRRPPEGLTADEVKKWKRIIKKAWTHDRNFLGWFWLDLGLGWAPIASLVPVIGPLWMWAVHGRLVAVAEELRIPTSMHAKMSANIFFDFLMSLIPILGAIFAWMNACSTRNASMVDVWIRKRIELEREMRGPFQLVDEGARTRRGQTGVENWRMKSSRVGAQEAGIVGPAGHSNGNGAGGRQAAPAQQSSRGASRSGTSSPQQTGFVSEHLPRPQHAQHAQQTQKEVQRPPKGPYAQTQNPQSSQLPPSPQIQQIPAHNPYAQKQAPQAPQAPQSPLTPTGSQTKETTPPPAPQFEPVQDYVPRKKNKNQDPEPVGPARRATGELDGPQYTGYVQQRAPQPVGRQPSYQLTNAPPPPPSTFGPASKASAGQDLYDESLKAKTKKKAKKAQFQPAQPGKVGPQETGFL